MAVERRGWVIAVESGSAGNGRNPIFNGRRQPSGGGTSRMTRECQVQICEKLGVQFPGSTRPRRLRPSPARFAGDNWKLPIRQRVCDRIEVTVAEVLKGALEQSVTHSGEIRAAKILKGRLG